MLRPFSTNKRSKAIEQKIESMYHALTFYSEIIESDDALATTQSSINIFTVHPVLRKYVWVDKWYKVIKLSEVIDLFDSAFQSYREAREFIKHCGYFIDYDYIPILPRIRNRQVMRDALNLFPHPHTREGEIMRRVLFELQKYGPSDALDTLIDIYSSNYSGRLGDYISKNVPSLLWKFVPYNIGTQYRQEVLIRIGEVLYTYECKGIRD